MIPCWNEQVIFNESYLYLIQTEETYPKVIVFFEVRSALSSLFFLPNYLDSVLRRDAGAETTTELVACIKDGKDWRSRPGIRPASDMMMMSPYQLYQLLFLIALCVNSTN